MIRPRTGLLGKASVKPYRMMRDEMAKQERSLYFRLPRDAEASTFDLARSVNPNRSPPQVTIEDYLASTKRPDESPNLPVLFSEKAPCTNTVRVTKDQHRIFSEKLDQSQSWLFRQVGHRLCGVDFIHRSEIRDGNPKYHSSWAAEYITRTTVVVIVQPGTKHQHWETFGAEIRRIFENVDDKFKEKWEFAGVVFETSSR
ncbi:hypothetical protein BGW36DRAFT_433454 [Talaromyces proteolyticus]|uniref:Uncharacterized protein n=1 Tax=Talaromyces proteolyticus TaxID=1131652 RepID=A0AAD4KHC0_9EURO|nr:uncharacterized protein BGW36DRAFT_433454 [Talaromyces proteolyticus]KAH8689454.1 hypothetical protein BGW36DRAFT_433454 [Talaromyces proteolyticus]